MKLVFVESREIYTHALAVPVSAEELHFKLCNLALLLVFFSPFFSLKVFCWWRKFDVFSNLFQSFSERPLPVN